MLAILTDSQQVDVTYADPVDKKGATAPVQNGSIVWKTSDPTVATVSAGAGFAGTIVGGLPGVAQIWPEADADLGDGVITIMGEKVDVQVTGGQAVGFGAPALGTPVEQA